MLVILGAMQEEINAYIEHMNQPESISWSGFRFIQGTLFGHEAVVARCGVGKVSAAMLTQKLIDLFAPTELLFTGIAGSLNPEYQIGDVVIARDTMQHDLDAECLGWPRGQIPYTDIRILVCDPDRAARLYAAGTPQNTMHYGRIVTGDTFINQKTSSRWSYLREELSGDAVEMEGASVATVAAYNSVPFNLIRIISDLADGHAPGDFQVFLHKASVQSAELVRNYLCQSQC